MENNRIRPLALAIIQRDNKILVQVGYDSKKDEKFYRLPGGGIEFGEDGIEALRREFKEEINSELSDIKFLGLLENIFTFEGKSGHEIVMIYNANLEKQSLYDEKEIKILDNEGHYMIWENIGVLKESHFYPEGIKKIV